MVNRSQVLVISHVYLKSWYLGFDGAALLLFSQVEGAGGGDNAHLLKEEDGEGEGVHPLASSSLQERGTWLPWTCSYELG